MALDTQRDANGRAQRVDRQEGAWRRGRTTTRGGVKRLARERAEGALEGIGQAAVTRVPGRSICSIDCNVHADDVVCAFAVPAAAASLRNGRRWCWWRCMLVCAVSALVASPSHRHVPLPTHPLARAVRGAIATTIALGTDTSSSYSSGGRQQRRSRLSRRLCILSPPTLQITPSFTPPPASLSTLSQRRSAGVQRAG